MATYKIIRYYRDTNHPDNGKLIRAGISLEEAQAHCSNPATRKADVYFDGYNEDPQHRAPRAGYEPVGLSKALRSLYQK